MIADILLSLGLPGWGLKLVMVLILFAAGTVMDNVPNLLSLSRSFPYSVSDWV